MGEPKRIYLCGACGHSTGFHPKREARNPLGCLECSCDLSEIGAFQALAFKQERELEEARAETQAAKHAGALMMDARDKTERELEAAREAIRVLCKTNRWGGKGYHTEIQRAIDAAREEEDSPGTTPEREQR